MDAEVERRTYPQLTVVAAQLIKQCIYLSSRYSYAKLAVPGIEPMTFREKGESSTELS